MVIQERYYNMLHQLQFSEHQQLCIHGELLSSPAVTMQERTTQDKSSSAREIFCLLSVIFPSHTIQKAKIFLVLLQGARTLYLSFIF